MHKGGPTNNKLKINFEDINVENKYNDSIAYGRSKAANILFAKELQKKMDAANINGLAVSLHPGVVRTDILRDITFTVRVALVIFYPLLSILTKTSWEGAQTTIYLAL